MSQVNINRVVLTGNLTHEPELRALPSGSQVCAMRMATNSSWRNAESGEWTERPNYFDVTVFGGQGEACARYLARGRPVAVEGRLDWREWQTPEGERRQAVQVIADTVQFLGRPPGSDAAEDELQGAVEEVAF